MVVITSLWSFMPVVGLMVLFRSIIIALVLPLATALALSIFLGPVMPAISIPLGTILTRAILHATTMLASRIVAFLIVASRLVATAHRFVATDRDTLASTPGVKPFTLTIIGDAFELVGLRAWI
jgi:hypothetical protein